MEFLSETRDFAHPRLGQEVTAIGGHYVFGKEIRMHFRTREILYLVGYAVLDSTCCGVGGVAYVLGVGFIQDWKYKKNQTDDAISRIELIRDLSIQKEVSRIIRQKEMVHQIAFA